MPNKYATVFNPTTGQRKVVKVGDPNAYSGGFQLQAANPNATRPVQTIDDLNRELQGAIGQYNQTQQTQYDVPQLVQQQLQQKSPEFGLSQEALTARYGNPQSPLYIENPFVREATITKALSNQQQAFSTVADKINSALGKRGLIEQQGVQGLQSKFDALTKAAQLAREEKQQALENDFKRQQLQIQRMQASGSGSDNTLSALKSLLGPELGTAAAMGYKRVQNDVGGYTFFGPDMKPISVDEFTSKTGLNRSVALSGSRDKADTAFALDKTQQQALGTLTDNIRQDPDVKDFVTVRDYYKRMQSAAPLKSGQGDLSLIFSYMKVLDPTSVVRETEYKNAAEAIGKIPALGNTPKKWWSGQKLTEEGRKGFLQAATELYNQKEQDHKRAVGLYTQQANAYGVDPSLVLRDYTTESSGGFAEKSGITSGGLRYTIEPN